MKATGKCEIFTLTMDTADEFHDPLPIAGRASPSRSAIVIGAGPAGSVAAILLARGGWDVTLVEQQTFPRDKVCGECLSALGLAVLDRAGLLPRLLARGMISLRRASLWSTAGRSTHLGLPADMAGLSRATLDTELRDAAVEAGAQLLQPARCEGIEPGTSPGVKVRELSSNQITDLRADIVLLADGKGGVTAGLSRPKNGDLGVKCHLAGVDGPRDTIELFGLLGHYVGLAAIDGNRWNLAMSVPKRRVAHFGGDFDRLLAAACEQNVALAGRLARATRTSVWHSSPLPRYAVTTEWPEGVILIGNSAAALEPIGGEGMGLALASAEIAVSHLQSFGANAEGGAPRHLPMSRVTSDTLCSNLAALKEAYRMLWNRRRRWCRLAAVVSSRPVWMNAAIALGDAEYGLTNWVADRMGKTPTIANWSPTVALIQNFNRSRTQ